jgi:hypothetical protein
MNCRLPRSVTATQMCVLMTEPLTKSVKSPRAQYELLGSAEEGGVGGVAHPGTYGECCCKCLGRTAEPRLASALAWQRPSGTLLGA